LNNDRLRVPVDDEYSKAIGLAMFAFARLEWNAVWCIEKLAPGSIGPVSERTAGGVGKALAQQVAALGLPVDHPLPKATVEYERLVKVRNGICHAKPGTDALGEQRLFREGVFWTIETINDAADDFTACEIKLNDLLYGFLRHTKT
jgi:hypothetical protein